MHRAAMALPLAVLLASCATPQTDRLLAEPPAVPSARTLAVPFFPQSRGHCGPAALAMALRASGDPVEPAALADWSYTPGAGGSFQHDLVGSVARRGRLAYPVTGLEDLIGEVAEGRPVVVLQNLAFGWWPLWHYALVVGYDLDRASVLMHTGTRAARGVPLDLLERTWSRSDHWGLVVLAPGELPASPDSAPLASESSGPRVGIGLFGRRMNDRSASALNALSETKSATMLS